MIPRRFGNGNFSIKIMSTMILDTPYNFLDHHMFVMMKIDDSEKFMHDPKTVSASSQSMVNTHAISYMSVVLGII